MGLDPQQTLNNVYIARAYNSDQQCFLIDGLFKICPEENVKLVVVDSMISHFRGEYVGRESLAERQQKLNQCLHKLLRMTEIYNMSSSNQNVFSSSYDAFELDEFVKTSMPFNLV
jgi:DNA repair protein RadA